MELLQLTPKGVKLMSMKATVSTTDERSTKPSRQKGRSMVDDVTKKSEIYQVLQELLIFFPKSGYFYHTKYNLVI